MEQAVGETLVAKTPVHTKRSEDVDKFQPTFSTTQKPKRKRSQKTDPNEKDSPKDDRDSGGDCAKKRKMKKPVQSILKFFGNRLASRLASDSSSTGESKESNSCADPTRSKENCPKDERDKNALKRANGSTQNASSTTCKKKRQKMDAKSDASKRLELSSSCKDADSRPERVESKVETGERNDAPDVVGSTTPKEKAKTNVSEKPKTTSTPTTSKRNNANGSSKKSPKIVLPPKETAIVVEEKNPKRGKSFERYEKYKKAKTLAEFYALGGTKADARNDIRRKLMRIVDAKERSLSSKEDASAKSNNSTIVAESSNPSSVAASTMEFSSPAPSNDKTSTPRLVLRSISRTNLPQGWKVVVKERGVKGGKAGTYTEFYAPDGSKHRSIAAVKRYLGMPKKKESKVTSPISSFCVTSTPGTSSAAASPEPTAPREPDARIPDLEKKMFKWEEDLSNLVGGTHNMKQHPEFAACIASLWKSVRSSAVSKKEDAMNALKPIVAVLLQDFESDAETVGAAIFASLNDVEEKIRSGEDIAAAASKKEDGDTTVTETNGNLPSSQSTLNLLSLVDSKDIVELLPLLAERTQYGSKSKPMYCWEVQNLMLLPQQFRTHVRDRRTLRRAKHRSVRSLENVLCLLKSRAFSAKHEVRVASAITKMEGAARSYETARSKFVAKLEHTRQAELKRKNAALEREKRKAEQRQKKEMLEAERQKIREAREAEKRLKQKQREEEKQRKKAAREEEKKRKQEEREREKERLSQLKLKQKRKGCSAITSFFSSPSAVSTPKNSSDGTCSSQAINVEAKPSSSSRRRLVEPSERKSRSHSKIPKGFMYVLSHDIPFEAEKPRPARLRRSKSSRPCSVVALKRGRNPFAKDSAIGDYSVDSDDEWALRFGDNGESLSAEEDDEEDEQEPTEAEYMLDGWLCSDDEVEYVNGEDNECENRRAVVSEENNENPKKWKPKSKRSGPGGVTLTSSDGEQHVVQNVKLYFVRGEIASSCPSKLLAMRGTNLTGSPVVVPSYEEEIALLAKAAQSKKKKSKTKVDVPKARKPNVLSLEHKKMLAKMMDGFRRGRERLMMKFIGTLAQSLKAKKAPASSATDDDASVVVESQDAKATEPAVGNAANEGKCVDENEPKAQTQEETCASPSPCDTKIAPEIDILIPTKKSISITICEMGAYEKRKGYFDGKKCWFLLDKFREEFGIPALPEPAPIAESPSVPVAAQKSEENSSKTSGGLEKFLSAKPIPLLPKELIATKGSTFSLKKRKKKSPPAKKEKKKQKKQLPPGFTEVKKERGAKGGKGKGTFYTEYVGPDGKKYRSLAAVLRSVSSSANNSTSRDVVAADAPKSEPAANTKTTPSSSTASRP